MVCNVGPHCYWWIWIIFLEELYPMPGLIKLFDAIWSLGSLSMFIGIWKMWDRGVCCVGYISHSWHLQGNFISNGRWFKSFLGRIFNFKFERSTYLQHECTTQTQPLLELKTRLRFCPVSYNFHMHTLLLTLAKQSSLLHYSNNCDRKFFYHTGLWI